jgi:phage tail sheath protein FI
MPQPLTYPGVYIEEVPSGVRTIVGVATSITAFLGRAPRGKVHRPVVCNGPGAWRAPSAYRILTSRWATRSPTSSPMAAAR